MKKKLILLLIVILIIISVLIILPFIKVDRNNQIKYVSYVEDFAEYEEVTCYDDSYSYYEEKDITIIGLNIKKWFIFYIYTIDYEKGNKCATEYLLEESYIKNFINNASIKYNEHDIDLASLIKNKTAIIGNTRYFGNDYLNSIEYVLDGKDEILYVFYQDDLLVIQVGLSDEGPKFIAYK